MGRRTRGTRSKTAGKSHDATQGSQARLNDLAHTHTAREGLPVLVNTAKQPTAIFAGFVQFRSVVLRSVARLAVALGLGGPSNILVSYYRLDKNISSEVQLLPKSESSPEP